MANTFSSFRITYFKQRTATVKICTFAPSEAAAAVSDEHAIDFGHRVYVHGVMVFGAFNMRAIRVPSRHGRLFDVEKCSRLRATQKLKRNLKFLVERTGNEVVEEITFDMTCRASSISLLITWNILVRGRCSN